MLKLKKEFADFYKEIKIDKETNALKEKREILEEDIKSKLPAILNPSDIEMESGMWKPPIIGNPPIGGKPPGNA